MTDKLDKKQVEAILGEKIGDDALQLINFVMRVAISTRTDGITTSRNVLIQTPNFCSQNYVKDVSGWATTAGNGQSVFKLSSFSCSEGELYNYPINVIATPVSSKPFFLTVNHSLVNSARDVEIKVFAWDANGAAARVLPLTGGVGSNFRSSSFESDFYSSQELTALQFGLGSDFPISNK